MSTAKKMLVFHSAYTFDDLKTLGLEIFVTARDAGEFFDRVLTVNPAASLQYSPEDPRRFSKPEFFQLDARNVVLEGRVGRFHFLERLRIVNFVFAQLLLFVTILRKGGLKDIALIRAEDPRLNGLYGYIFSLLLRKPLVVGVWGNPERIRKEQGKQLMPGLFPNIQSERMVEKFVLRRAAIVLAQNADNMAYALEFGVPEERTRILPLGIGIDPVHFLSGSDRTDVGQDFKDFGIASEFVMVCISRLESLKLVDHAVRACRVLKDADIEFTLILIGEGREKEKLLSLAKEIGIEDSVIFAGNRSQEWIAGALNRAHLAFAPLTGRALLEIALSGCPVIAYDVDWHAEIVRTGDTGILVENLNEKKMGEAALEILRDEPRRMKMGRNIRSLALEMASPEAIIRKQIEIYQRLTS